jgi:predicted aldo/keto reductase-like oxidoreductase
MRKGLKETYDWYESRGKQFIDKYTNVGEYVKKYNEVNGTNEVSGVYMICFNSLPIAIGESSQMAVRFMEHVRALEEDGKDGQYYRTRDMAYVRPAFEDLLERLRTDYIDLGMIHYVDSEKEWDRIQSSDYMEYIMELKSSGVIRHIGMSSHNPKVAIKAALSGFVEMILFSINPAFDMLPAGEDINVMFAEEYDKSLKGINPDRALLYKTCVEKDVGITVMKGFAGGRLLDEKRSPFGVSLSVIRCIHYALTRPAVSSIMCGFDTKDQVDEAVKYETASEDEKDYASVIATAPLHSYMGQCTYCGHCKPCPVGIDIAMVNKYYDLATMQPEVPATIRSHYELLEHHASECISCKGCESRCPFRVDISERMKKTAELFGV